MHLKSKQKIENIMSGKTKAANHSRPSARFNLSRQLSVRDQALATHDLPRLMHFVSHANRLPDTKSRPEANQPLLPGFCSSRYTMFS
jgi:hypothetical protein